MSLFPSKFLNSDLKGTFGAEEDEHEQNEEAMKELKIR